MGSFIIGVLILMAIGPLLVYGLAYFTVLVEKPVIIKSGITDKERLVKSLNICTNVSFNLITVLIYYLCRISFQTDYKIPVYLWTAVAELLIIPLWEISVYKKVSDKSTCRITIFTYLANFLSFALGFVVFGFIGKVAQVTILGPFFGI